MIVVIKMLKSEELLELKANKSSVKSQLQLNRRSQDLSYCIAIVKYFDTRLLTASDLDCIETPNDVTSHPIQ